MGSWDINLTAQVEDWFLELAKDDPDCANQVAAAIDMLSEVGPTLGRPLVDQIKASRHQNMKELRPGSTGNSEIRILFAFDPERSAILLIAGDKAGKWKEWYKENVALADEAYDNHLAELKGQHHGE
ncbi:type II toxin-antitoxin system RelE/ParE family toxin [Plantactinospora sp. ZYX-F-223]|uniref:type II toxin-antitoxin system RelE/ParE family toxin n=1 Tax=Plantactinospora sp. ZYX-F-223 TaxID=3144103 RepID=UPI0031FCD89A